MKILKKTFYNSGGNFGAQKKKNNSEKIVHILGNGTF